MLGAIDQATDADLPTVDVTGEIPREQLVSSDADPDNFDPHIWLDVQLWKVAATTVANHLAEADQDHAADYQANLDEYLGQLDQLDAFIRTELAGVPEDRRILLTGHAAFRYFGAAYGFETESIQPSTTVPFLSEQVVDQAAARILAQRVDTVFLETTIPLADAAALQEVCREHGLDLTVGGEVYSDTLGRQGSSEGTYIGMMRANAVIIARGLG